MTTTIKVSEETKKLLELKKKDSKKTYDEIVKELLRNQLEIREEFGKYNLSEWNKKKDRLDLDDSD